MWKKSFLMFLFSLSVQKAALDCERIRKTNGKFHVLLCCTKAAFTETVRQSALIAHRHGQVLLCFLMNSQREEFFHFVLFKMK